MQFVISQVCLPKELPSEAIRRIKLSLDSTLLASSRADEYLDEVVTFLIDHSGQLPVTLFIDDDESVYVKSAFSIAFHKGIREELKELALVKNAYLA